MMKKIAVITLPLLLLTGCSVDQIAQTAADAAACKALEGTLAGLDSAYTAGLVDSGVIAQLDSLVGEQLDSLLSTALASDIRALASELSNTSSAQTATATVTELTDSINARCEAVGVLFEGGN